MPLEFKINDYLSLKLESGRTNIYVGGIIFRQCKHIMINIPISDIQDFQDIDSIDQAVERSIQVANYNNHSISPEEEFWGHCSNLQAWCEHEYDTRLLDKGLAFSLLKKLMISGDPLSKRVFKREFIKLIESGHLPMLHSLLIDYPHYFTTEELCTINWDNILLTLENYMNSISKFIMFSMLHSILQDTPLMKNHPKLKEYPLYTSTNSLELASKWVEKNKEVFEVHSKEEFERNCLSKEEFIAASKGKIIIREYKEDEDEGCQ